MVVEILKSIRYIRAARGSVYSRANNSRARGAAVSVIIRHLRCVVKWKQRPITGIINDIRNVIVRGNATLRGPAE